MHSNNTEYFAKAYNLNDEQTMMIDALVTTGIPMINEMDFSDDPNPKRLTEKAKKKAKKKRKEFDEVIEKVKALVPGHRRIWVSDINMPSQKLILDALEYEKKHIDTLETMEVWSNSHTKQQTITHKKKSYKQHLVNSGMSPSTAKKMLDHIFTTNLK